MWFWMIMADGLWFSSRPWDSEVIIRRGSRLTPWALGSAVISAQDLVLAKWWSMASGPSSPSLALCSWMHAFLMPVSATTHHVSLCLLRAGALQWIHTCVVCVCVRVLLTKEQTLRQHVINNMSEIKPKTWRSPQAERKVMYDSGLTRQAGCFI